MMKFKFLLLTLVGLVSFGFAQEIPEKATPKEIEVLKKVHASFEAAVPRNQFTGSKPNWEKVTKVKYNDRIVYEAFLGKASALIYNIRRDGNENGKRLSEEELMQRDKRTSPRLLFFYDPARNKYDSLNYLQVNAENDVDLEDLHFPSFTNFTGTMMQYFVSGELSGGFVYKDGKKLQRIYPGTKELHEASQKDPSLIHNSHNAPPKAFVTPKVAPTESEIVELKNVFESFKGYSVKFTIDGFENAFNSAVPNWEKVNKSIYRGDIVYEVIVDDIFGIVPIINSNESKQADKEIRSFSLNNTSLRILIYKIPSTNNYSTVNYVLIQSDKLPITEDIRYPNFTNFSGYISYYTYTNVKAEAFTFKDGKRTDKGFIITSAQYDAIKKGTSAETKNK